MIKYLLLLIFLLSCNTFRPTVKSLEKTKEVQNVLIENQKAIKTNNPVILKKALKKTEKNLEDLLFDYQESESMKVKQGEKIIKLKDELKTWKIIKWTFWIVVILTSIFGIGKLISKFRPSLF